MFIKDPQNPYNSFMVEASAGTGKTYQLTQRFLFLVGAGADPSEILAITFTVKAVGEMHERIISEASHLLVNKEAQAKFEKKLEIFYANFISEQEKNYLFSKPRSAKATAELILSSTQRLKITTIDSIFYEWVTRFPAESASDAKEKESFLRSLNLVESYENEKLHRDAWDLLLKDKESREEFEKNFKRIETVFPQKGLLGIQKQVEELYRYRLHIFYLEQKGYEPFLSYTMNAEKDFLAKNLSDIVLQVQKELFELVRHTTKEEVLRGFVQSGNFEGLANERFLTKKGLVSKTLLRGAKREGLSSVISQVEDIFSLFFNEKSKQQLNDAGESLFLIYKLWSSKRDQIKKNLMVCEFSDLSMACHNLFSKDSNGSILWLLQKSIHHILIDEFQDTSMVQWEIFSHLMEDILSSFESSSDDKSHKTSFIVGDRKQSIYGFREADPFVMNLSSDFFEQYEKQIVSLNASYRTSPLIMSFLSDFFVKKIDKNFPVHVTAKKECNNPVIPDVARVVVCENISSEESKEITPLEKEAENLALFFEEFFNNRELYPIYDKEKKVFRTINPSDCCVLYRNATHVDTFLEALDKKDIPTRREAESNFFEYKEVKAVISLLKFFVNPKDILSLVSFFSSPLFDFDKKILLQALLETKDKASIERVEKFFEYLEKEKIFLTDFLQLREEVFCLVPHKILFLLYAKIPSATLFSSEEEKKERTGFEKNLMKLLDFFLELEKKGFSTLISCLEEIEKISEIGLQMGQDSSKEAVTFMSIHKSKGLEFPLVSLIEASDSWFKFDRYWIKSSHGIHYSGTYDAMPHEDKDFKTVHKNSEKLMFEESIRLLYVALTRASQYLFISAHSSSSGTASRFHGELISYLKAHRCSFDEKKKWFILESGMSPPPALSSFYKNQVKETKKDIDFIFRAAKDIKIITPHEENTQFLFSEDYEYKKKNSSKSERLSSLLGTFVHKCFELKILKKNFSYEKLWNKIVEISPVWKSEKLTDKEKSELFLEKKEECELNFYSDSFQSLFKNAKEIEAEYPILSLHGSFMTKGVIDLFVLYESGDILLVDFKTSFVSSCEDLRNFCEMKGYAKQLSNYEVVIKEIYPDSFVKKVIYFTKICQMIDV